VFEEDFVKKIINFILFVFLINSGTDFRAPRVTSKISEVYVRGSGETIKLSFIS